SKRLFRPGAIIDVITLTSALGALNLRQCIAQAGLSQPGPGHTVLRKAGGTARLLQRFRDAPTGGKQPCPHDQKRSKRLLARPCRPNVARRKSRNSREPPARCTTP